MARDKGLASFSANFEAQIAAPIDARFIVPTKAELLLEATWTANDGGVYTYVGMKVIVHSDGTELNKGLYWLNSADYTQEANWTKISGSGTNHSDLLEIGTYTHDEIDDHVEDSTIHFIEGEIDHSGIINSGTLGHDMIDTHIGDDTIHYEEGEIDHSGILNIGTKGHDLIDTHIADSDIHDARQMVFYAPDSINKAVGTLNGGDETDVEFIDSDLYDIQEVTGVPGFDLRFNFVDVEVFNQFRVHFKYSGDVTHTVCIDLYNYDTVGWDTFTTFTLGTAFQYIAIPVDDSTDYIDGSGNAILRLYHLTTGNTAHQIEVDYIALTTGDVGGTSEHGLLTNLDVHDHLQYFRFAGEETTAQIGTNSTNTSALLRIHSEKASYIEMIADVDDDSITASAYIAMREDFDSKYALLGWNATVGKEPGNVSDCTNALVDAFLIGTQTKSPFQIFVNSTVAMTVLTNGKVGIGTNAPDYKLHLDGNMKHEGRIFYTSESRTLSGGSINIGATYVRVDTQSGVASDDLDTINSGVDGQILILQAEDSTHTVVVKHGTDNINLAGSADFSLNDRRDKIMLIYNGEIGEWDELSRSAN